MTTIKRSTFAFALLVAGRIATAQNAPDGSSSADVERVMRKYEAALGGRPLLLSIKTREIASLRYDRTFRCRIPSSKVRPESSGIRTRLATYPFCQG